MTFGKNTIRYYVVETLQTTGVKVKKVLFVDDDEGVCRLFVKMAHFGKHNLEIITVSDPTKVMETVRQHPNIDVVIVDGCMTGQINTIDHIQAVLGKDTQYIATSCDQDFMKILHKKGFTILSAHRKTDVLDIIRK